MISGLGGVQAFACKLIELHLVLAQRFGLSGFRV